MAEIKVPFHKAAITQDEENAVLDVLRSGWLTTGKYALEFEKKFRAAVSRVYALPLPHMLRQGDDFFEKAACDPSVSGAVLRPFVPAAPSPPRPGSAGSYRTASLPPSAPRRSR